jgi:hypothetical protein
MAKNLKKRVSSHEDHFPKTLFVLSQCRIAENDGSGNLLFRSQMHVDERDEVGLAHGLFIGSAYMAATRIYREDPPRVMTFRNQLGLSLSKRNRHGLVEKINDKRRPQTCETLGRISADHSRAHHVAASIASPRHTPPGPARPNEAR